jgi:ABC-type uncharacterized transport system permease subunit
MSKMKTLMKEQLLPPILALLIGLLIAAFLMWGYGYDPWKAYKALFFGGFGSIKNFSDSLAFATPLMLTGLTFAICAKAGLFNIGAEGQVYIGAIGAVIMGGLVSLPKPLHITLTLLFAMGLGALWAIGPALLKIWRGVHEVISTIMFNWIAFYTTMYLALYKLYQPGRAERTIPVHETARFGVLVGGTSLTTVIFVAILFNVIVYLYLIMTRSGYELKLLGANPDAARFAGVKPGKIVLYSFIIGGMASGLAGATQIMGRPPAYALYGTLGNVLNLGFDGIGVALIGRNNPIGIIFASILFGGLLNGGRFMEYQAGVYSELVDAITGLIIIALSIPELVKLFKAFRRRRARIE